MQESFPIMKQPIIIFFILWIVPLNASDNTGKTTQTPPHQLLVKKIKDLVKRAQEEERQNGSHYLSSGYNKLYTAINCLQNATTPESQLQHLLHLIQLLETPHELLKKKAETSTDIFLIKKVKAYSTHLEDLRAWAAILLQKKITLQAKPICVVPIKDSRRNRIEVITPEQQKLTIPPATQQKLTIPPATQQNSTRTEQTSTMQKTPVIQKTTSPINSEKKDSSLATKGNLTAFIGIISGIVTLLSYLHQRKLHTKMCKLRNETTVHSYKLKNLHNQYQTAKKCAIASGAITAITATAIALAMHKKHI
jgi:hypothetical protein